MRLRHLAVVIIVAAPLAVQAQKRPGGSGAEEQVRPRGGGGNTDMSPLVYKSWPEAQSSNEGARNKFLVARDKYNNAKKKYDDLQFSGGGSPEKAGQIAEAERAKDDAHNVYQGFKNAYMRASAGAVNFAEAEAKAATTDADKKTAAAHKTTALRWKGEAN